MMNLTPNARTYDPRAHEAARLAPASNRERLPAPLDDTARAAVQEFVIGAAVVLVHFAALYVFL
jgi:hypothetical protein